MEKKVIVHCSGLELGGAEQSLLQAILEKCSPQNLLFVIPGEGRLAKKLKEIDVAYKLLPIPKALHFFTQRQWFWQWPFYVLLIPSLIVHAWRLNKILSTEASLISCGIKSHLLVLWLLPFLRSRMIFDIRDFIHPLALRKFLSTTFSLFNAQVQANSQAIAKDFGYVQVLYPKIQLPRQSMPRQNSSGPKIISHLAYFAPYKGQHLFLKAARALLDAGVNAEFWIIGDIIYPGKKYRDYKNSLLELRRELKLEDKVKFWGIIPYQNTDQNANGSDVQSLLEQTHLLLHCTVEPEPFGRAIVEALQCGAEVICHKGSGACETLQIKPKISEAYQALNSILSNSYVQVTSR